jgi:hypothetical protein
LGDEKATVGFMVKACRDWKQINVQRNVSQAVAALKIEVRKGIEPYELSFNEEKIRESPGFRGM